MKTVCPVRRTTSELVRLAFPERRRDTHKGDYGRVLLICGSEGFSGAPSLAARAALRCGSGLIEVAVPRCIYPIVASRLEAPMVFPVPDDGQGRISLQALPLLLKKLSWCDACLIGPGLGQSHELEELVQALLSEAKVPVVLDADGLNLISRHMNVLRREDASFVLTPHEGEFRRLTSEPETDRISGAAALAAGTKAVVLRKGHETVITDGKKHYVNRTGNPGMATGGSGDVLAGILVSILGRGVPALEAAAAAAWLHGAAGDLCAAEMGQTSMSPVDLTEHLCELLP